MTDSSVTIDRHLESGLLDDEMAREIRRAFTQRPIVLAPRWLYDDHGSELFDRITRLAEYYPTEAERSLLVERADEVARLTGSDTVVELGSGTSDKTRTLLDAFHRRGQLSTFVPLDVSEGTLEDAARMLASRYDGLAIHALVGDFNRHLRHIPNDAERRRVVSFLGGTIGNFYVEERRAFLGALADQLRSDEWLLLGVDLVKPLDRIVDAYFDADGVTERFIKNSLTVINRRFDGDFDLTCFDYAPLWDARQGRVDMRLRSTMPQTATLRRLDLDVELAAGEEIRVEISTKFEREALIAELSDVGLEVERFWTDDPGDFGLLLARRSGDRPSPSM